ncbi:MAG: ribosomal protein S18-alanine N-acetyltransferase [Anaerolineae bacterium]|nr:ribosomal protein S18-alanine N-acetyltransferase [Anaerolineae bacterium]
MAVGTDIRTYTIRRMEPRDIPAVVKLDHQVFLDPWPESAYIQELYFNPNACYFVLEIPTPAKLRGRWPWKTETADPIQGFIGMRVERSNGHISTLAIHPELRGHGFGEFLLITALRQAIEMEACCVLLEVRVSNHPAQNLYRKYDFEVVGRQPRYYQNGEDALLMELAPLGPELRRRLTARQRVLESRIRGVRE